MFHLDVYHTRDALLDAFYFVRDATGHTYTALALNTATNDMFIEEHGDRLGM